MKTIPTLVIALVTTTLAFAQQQPPSPTALAAANNAFACDLYAQLKDTKGNLFFSPFSVSSALAMAYAGANGDTAAQMRKALRFSDAPAQENKNIHASFAELLKHFDDVQRDGSVQLDIANALWPQKNAETPLLESYLTFVKQNYGVEITPVDFVRAEPKARSQINRWVAEKTHDKIQNLIGAPLDSQTRLVLVNAIYFKSAWSDSFKAKQTENEAFFVEDKNVVQAPLMRQTKRFNYAESDNCQILELPYKGGKLSMLVLLPVNRTPAGLKELENNLTNEQITKWKTQLKKVEVQVFFPRFKFEWGAASLMEALKKLGMRDAFVIGDADFSGMNGHKDFLISDVLQKALIDVGEKGTVAVATTEVVVWNAFGVHEGPPPPPVFRADHPFLFFIQDNATGSILFMGRVVNPAAQ